MARGRFLSIAVLLTLAAAASAAAQPFPTKDLPPELRPWVPWVLDEVADAGCPRVGGVAVCLWPGRLQLELGAAGGTFAIDLEADRAAALALPGSGDLWPQDVRLDGAPAPAYERDGAPQLRVTAGRHHVTGRFAWSRMPQSLNVPPAIGLVDLRLDGRLVARPRRESGGSLWLRARSETNEEGDSLRLQAFRRVADGIPLFVETRIQLEVAGRAREVTLAGALLPGSVPVSVRGELPARIEDGTLRVQVRGGRHTVVVDARLEGAPAAIARPSGRRSADWPEREIWVFAADEKLRQVELSGPPAIDPSRTELPSEWRPLPAFLVEAGARLVLKEVRRGQPSPPPDALKLTRVLWLDPDGNAASVRDSFGGTLRSTRLDLAAKGTLGRVALDGQDQLVTANPETKAAGIELRREALRLEADSRLSLHGAWNAVGWTTGVQQLGATVNVPPGWTVLGASGVDQLPDTWTARWTLLGFFFVLVVTLAVYRLFGLAQALVALATLVLLHGEPGAPFIVWLSLVAAIALQRVTPAGRSAALARLWFLASAAILVVLIVPFARDQVTAALYPQVPVVFAEEGRLPGPQPPSAMKALVCEPRGTGDVAIRRRGDRQEPAAEAPMQAPEGALMNQPLVRDKLAPKTAYAPYSRVSPQPQSSETEASFSFNRALEQDPKAVLQTGPGVPTWTWRSYSLGWTGPVGRDHRVRLFLASPGTNRLLTLVRLALLAALSFLLIVGRWPRLPRPAAFASAGAAAFLALALVGVAPATAAEDERQREAAAEGPETPGPEILERLKQRLIRPAACDPSCVSTPTLVLRLGESRLEVSAEVRAAADGTWAVPGPLSSWAAASLRLDGAPAIAAAHQSDGFLRVRLTRGVHRVEASGPLPPGDAFALQFADVPRRARAEAPGWDVSGLRSDGPAEASILLTRRLTARMGAASEGRYAPWLEVTRTLGFGVAWTVETRVRRLTPLGMPVAVRIPLLAGEAPTRASLVVAHGEAAVSLAGDEAETGWESTLVQTPSLRLEAPKGALWSELWRLQCSAIWPCTASGLPPVTRVAAGVFTPEYRPWPGEALAVDLRHPQGVEGQTLTIDSVSLESEPGSRLESVQLLVAARSSREQPLVVRLPNEAELQTASIDGQERPSRPEAGELRLTMPSGSHAIVLRWQQPRGLAFAHSLPQVSLSAPAVNVRQQLTLPPSRWLLAVHGPAWGPAVLFWSYLLFVLAVAFGLGRLPSSPLTSGQWLLLGLGLSQLPALGALVVAGFVFALAHRGRRPPASPATFDLLQVVLALWTLASLVLLYLAIQQGLLFRPDMQVAGNGSSDTVLRWYTDRISGQLPVVRVVSLPLWTYRVAMLVWSLWLAASLVRAVGWGWRAFGSDGFWRPLGGRTSPSGSITSLAPAPGEGGTSASGKP